MQGLQGALARAFPECSDLSDDPGRGITEFAPHLSVANVGVKADRVEEHKEALGAKWETLSFEVAEVYVISRSGFDDPFATRFRVPLGGGRSVEALRAESSAAPAASLPAAAASALEPSGASMEDLREPYVASVGSDPDTQASSCRGVFYSCWLHSRCDVQRGEWRGCRGRARGMQELWQTGRGREKEGRKAGKKRQRNYGREAEEGERGKKRQRNYGRQAEGGGRGMEGGEKRERNYMAERQRKGGGTEGIEAETIWHTGRGRGQEL